MNKIVVLGRVAVDFNPIDYNKPLEESTKFNKYVGGSAGNTAIGLQRLGNNVKLFSRVSENQLGKFVLNYLSKNNIDTKYIQIDSEHDMGLTFTEIKSEIESSILMYRHDVADLYYDGQQMDYQTINSADAIVISGTALAKSPSREAVISAVSYAEENNVKIIFDLDYRPYTWKNKFEISTYYKLIAEKSNIIIGSKMEFDLLDCTKKESSQEIAKKYLTEKTELIIIKFGKNGSKAYSNNLIYNVKPFQTKVLKSFGGGDAYASCVIDGIVKNQKIEEYLFKATAHAAMLVSSHSCSEGLATSDEITAFINNSSQKIEDVVKVEKWK